MAAGESSSRQRALAPSRVASWKISPDVSRQEALQFQESLNQRLGEQLRAKALERGDRATVARISQLLKSGRLVWTTPAHAYFSYRVLTRARTSAAKLSEALGLLEYTAQHAPPSRFSCDATRTAPEWAQDAIRSFDKAMSAYHGRRCMSSLGNSHLAWAERLVDRSADLIGEVWPEAAADMNRLVRDVVLLAGDALESSSTVSTFGAIYICPQPQWLVAYYVETLLHETAHYSFDIKSALTDFLRNPGVPAQSPFRGDQRSLEGILGSAFVLARSTHGLARLLEFSGCPQRAETRRFFLRWRQKFSDALTTLSHSARWTPWGERLFQTLRDCYSELPR